MTEPEAPEAPEPEDDTCPDCGGDGFTEQDRADRRGEHYTVTVPCPTCAAGDDSGSDDGDDFDDSGDW